MKRLPLLAVSTTLPATAAHAAQLSETTGPTAFPTILFGAAYYDEYSPYDRLDEDVRMMKQAGITVVSPTSFWKNTRFSDATGEDENDPFSRSDQRTFPVGAS